MGSQEIIFSLFLSFLLIPNIEKYKKNYFQMKFSLSLSFLLIPNIEKHKKTIFIGWCLLCAAIALLLTI